MQEARPEIHRILENEIRELGGIKYQLGLRISMRKDQIQGPPTYSDTTFYHEQIPLLNENEIDLQDPFDNLSKIIESWTNQGSGWVIERVEYLRLNIAKYQPLHSGSYIDLLAYLKNKKAIVNVKNKDDNCLRWAIRSALFPATNHSDRLSSYPSDDNLIFTEIHTPTPINQIQKVEKLNNLALNVYGFDGKNIIIYQLSKQPVGMRTINLMLIEKDGKTHYTWIKDLNRLLHDQNKYGGKTYFCERCLHGYSREDLLEQHKPECLGNGERVIKIEMPTQEKSTLEFENWHKTMKAPYVIYADFESIIK